jgi:6-pyruvoyltetrahydropterin/6-carboxytetrahydropterin synthase
LKFYASTYPVIPISSSNFLAPFLEIDRFATIAYEWLPLNSVGRFHGTFDSRNCLWRVALRNGLKGWRLLVNFAAMSRTFTIEVAKDYFNFASAHFLIFANGKREPLHGHNYQVSVKMEGELDPAGVVLDFISFKPLVKRICDSLDHRTMIQSNSPELSVQRRAKEIEVRYKAQKIILPKSDVILLPLLNTSTELLAEHVAKLIRRQVKANFRGAKIRVIEVGVEEARGQRGIYCGEF